MLSGKGLTIKGELTADEDLAIDFSFEGFIDLPGHKLIVPETSSVVASVKAASVVVHGHLEGHIAAEHVRITKTGTVDGSVVTPHLAIEDGALFNGPVNTERAHAAGSVAQHRRQAGDAGPHR